MAVPQQQSGFSDASAVQELGRHDGRVDSVAALADGRVVSGGDDCRVLVWDPSDRTPFAGYSTLVSPDGNVITLEQDVVALSSSETWTSPVTGIEYPSGWTLTIPSLELILELEPVLVDSEFAGSRYTPAAYWEGEVRVTGTRQGRNVGGRGFVELVGYDPRQLEAAPTP
ncbi:MAG: hypothetical protein IIC28_12600 [Chloroflexi bacterium]|nr:hypothetical protein [Chloroflexota bacterium]